MTLPLSSITSDFASVRDGDSLRCSTTVCGGRLIHRLNESSDRTAHVAVRSSTSAVPVRSSVRTGQSVSSASGSPRRRGRL